MPALERSLTLLRLALAVALAGPLAARSSPAAVPPAPDRYVTDGSGVLPPERASALDRKLADFERQTSTQVLVWIAPRVPEGTTAEELGAEAIRAWGVGQEGKDNGAVLFLFTEDRTLRLATGYGLEGAIPDVRAKRILREVVKPHLARGDFPAGIEAGVEEILKAARGEPFAGTGRTVKEGTSRYVVAAGWVAVALLLAYGAFRRPLLVFGVGLPSAVVGLLAAQSRVIPRELGPPLIVLLVGTSLLFLLGMYRFVMRQFRTSWGGRTGGWWASSSGSGGSSSSSSSWESSSSYSSSSGSSSGFSGGGGDSGGGGASESY